jgi:hypothetical protein
MTLDKIIEALYEGALDPSRGIGDIVDCRLRSRFCRRTLRVQSEYEGCPTK